MSERSYYFSQISCTVVLNEIIAATLGSQRAQGYEENGSFGFDFLLERYHKDGD
jgi:hypothetical protein